ncbi:MAG: glycosyltransferase [Chloroflexota bacterium]
MFANLIDFLTETSILIPVGLIGLWRWTAWLIKRSLSALWRDSDQSERTKDWKVGVALTVKGEPTETFQQVLECLAAEGIDQVCIVFDFKEHGNILSAYRFIKRYRKQIDVRIAETNKKGKRNGLSQAIGMCEGVDVIMCMDSDTLLGEGVKEAVLAAFANPRVGGVAVGQRCYRPKSWVEHLFDIRLVVRYAQDIPGQALGGRITCLSGRCSAYLAEPLQKVAPGLLSEKWAGIAKTGGGDDKFLTTAIHDEGYLTVATRKAWVYTRPEPSFKTYVSQSLRWARNSWFSDLRALLSRSWIYKSPVLLFYTVDRMVSSFTILVGIWFMAFAIYQQQWLAAGILLIWWHVSRIIKGWTYFSETKRFFMIVPYTFMSFFIGILKIHALVTLYEGSWLTRGATSQAKLRKQVLDGFSKLGTAVVIGSIGLAIYALLISQIPVAPDRSDPSINFVAIDPYSQSVSGFVLDPNEEVYFYFPLETVSIDTFDARSSNNGRVTYMVDNVLQYRPPRNYEGVDTFSYSISYGESTVLAEIELVIDDELDETELLSQ